MTLVGSHAWKSTKYRGKLITFPIGPLRVGKTGPALRSEIQLAPAGTGAKLLGGLVFLAPWAHFHESRPCGLPRAGSVLACTRQNTIELACIPQHPETKDECPLDLLFELYCASAAPAFSRCAACFSLPAAHPHSRRHASHVVIGQSQAGQDQLYMAPNKGADTQPCDLSHSMLNPYLHCPLQHSVVITIRVSR